MRLSARYADLVSRFDQLPDDAIIPVTATAQLFNISPRTVRNRFPSVQITPGRLGNRVGVLRSISRGEKPAADTTAASSGKAKGYVNDYRRQNIR
jgi:hypothetical protein